jgi:hypothetical protein
LKYWKRAAELGHEKAKQRYKELLEEIENEENYGDEGNDENTLVAEEKEIVKSDKNYSVNVRTGGCKFGSAVCNKCPDKTKQICPRKTSLNFHNPDGEVCLFFWTTFKFADNCSNGKNCPCGKDIINCLKVLKASVEEFSEILCDNDECGFKNECTFINAKEKNEKKIKEVISSNENVKYTTVIVNRKISVIGSDIPTEIVVDGKVMTKLEIGEVKEFNVVYGKHTIHAETDQKCSENIEFLANSEKMSFIVQWKLLGGLSIDKVGDDEIDTDGNSAFWGKALKVGLTVAGGIAKEAATTHTYQCRYCGQLMYKNYMQSSTPGCPRNPYRVHIWDRVD